MQFKEKSLIKYKNYTGHIKCVCKNYFTFTPLNTTALMLVYVENWKDVTVLEVAQTS
jgi:hypothetical protein